MEEENVDIDNLFDHYNALYFHSELSCCVLKWSSDLPLNCTGSCHYDSGEFGCEIHLSEPLLKFMPSPELKNILLHEMIHALLWIKDKNGDNSDHGSSFQETRNSIMSSSVMDSQRPRDGYNIPLHHKFEKDVSVHGLKKEIKTYRFHHYMCDTCGDCIKKTRYPSARNCIDKVDSDEFCGNLLCQWHTHKSLCTGCYIIAVPRKYKEKKTSLKDLKCDKVILCATRELAKIKSVVEAMPDEEMDSEAEQEIQEDDRLERKQCQTKGALGGLKCDKVVLCATRELAKMKSVIEAMSDKEIDSEAEQEIQEDGQLERKQCQTKGTLEDLECDKVKVVLCATREVGKMKSVVEAMPDEEMDSKAEQEIQEDGQLERKQCQTKGTLEDLKCDKVVLYATRELAKMKSVVKAMPDKEIDSEEILDDYSLPVIYEMSDDSEKTNCEKSQAIVIRTRRSTVASQKTNGVGKHLHTRKRSYGNKKRKQGGEWKKWKNEVASVGKWFTMYGEEEEDEEIVPLKDKRTERRKKLKLMLRSWKNDMVTSNGMDGEEEDDDECSNQA